MFSVVLEPYRLTAVNTFNTSPMHVNWLCKILNRYFM
nr:MAG TPA: hypothetical protein [Caudoviricetes sp.]